MSPLFQKNILQFFLQNFLIKNKFKNFLILSEKQYFIFFLEKNVLDLKKKFKKNLKQKILNQQNIKSINPSIKFIKIINRHYFNTKY